VRGSDAVEEKIVFPSVLMLAPCADKVTAMGGMDPLLMREAL